MDRRFLKLLTFAKRNERKRKQSREKYSGGLTGGRRARASTNPTLQQPPGRQHCSAFISTFCYIIAVEQYIVFQSDSGTWRT